MPGFFWKVKDFKNAIIKQPNNFIASSDGKIYEVRDSTLGRIVMHHDYIPQFDQINEGFSFNLPKIPASILRQVMSFFQAYCLETNPLEVYLRIYYDNEEERYFLHCPKQYITSVSVSVDEDEFIDEVRYLHVMDIHSHNTMRAYFSTRDNNDELAYRLYAVIGRINTAPQIKLRVGARGKHLMLNPLSIFESVDLTPDNEYPTEWDESVIKIT